MGEFEWAEGEEEGGEEASNIEGRVEELRALLESVVEEIIPADCLLLSGGMGSDVIAELAADISAARREGGSSGFREAVTVACGKRAADRVHAGTVARKLALRWHVVSGRAVEVMEGELRFVVRTLRTFDPIEVHVSSIILSRKPVVWHFIS